MRVRSARVPSCLISIAGKVSVRAISVILRLVWPVPRTAWSVIAPESGVDWVIFRRRNNNLYLISCQLIRQKNVYFVVDQTKKNKHNQITRYRQRFYRFIPIEPTTPVGILGLSAACRDPFHR